MLIASTNKIPQVPNHDNIIEIIPLLQQMLKKNGDIEFDPNELHNFIKY